MLVICPSCEAEYRIEAAALGDGRRVRCARCKTHWFAEAPPVPIESLDDAEPIVSIEDAEIVDADASQPKPPVPKRRRLGFIGVTSRAAAIAPGQPGEVRAPKRAARRRAPRIRPAAVFATLGIAALAAILLERVEVVRAAPALASLYRIAGLDVNVRGLDIRDVRSREDIEDGVPLLLVTGGISNVTDQPVDVPRLRLAVTSADDRELYAWTTVSARAKLAPGESATFRARLASPPAEGQAVSVRFLGRQDIAARTAH